MKQIKDIVFTVNLMLSISSCAVLITLLIFGYFGWAWLCTLPAAYTILNIVAIYKED